MSSESESITPHEAGAAAIMAMIMFLAVVLAGASYFYAGIVAIDNHPTRRVPPILLLTV